MSKETEPLFIEDGMTREFRIERDPGIHGTLIGERRMVTDKEVQRYSRTTKRFYDQKKSENAEAYRNSFIAEHVVSWNIYPKGKDEPAEITPENVARIPAVLLTKLEAVVLGVGNDGTGDTDEIADTLGN